MKLYIVALYTPHIRKQNKLYIFSAQITDFKHVSGSVIDSGIVPSKASSEDVTGFASWLYMVQRSSRVGNFLWTPAQVKSMKATTNKNVIAMPIDSDKPADISSGIEQICNKF